MPILKKISPVDPFRTAPEILPMSFIENYLDAKFLGVAGVDVIFMQEYITS